MDTKMGSHTVAQYLFHEAEAECQEEEEEEEEEESAEKESNEESKSCESQSPRHPDTPLLSTLCVGAFSSLLFRSLCLSLSQFDHPELEGTERDIFRIGMLYASSQLQEPDRLRLWQRFPNLKMTYERQRPEQQDSEDDEKNQPLLLNKVPQDLFNKIVIFLEFEEVMSNVTPVCRTLYTWTCSLKCWNALPFQLNMTEYISVDLFKTVFQQSQLFRRCRTLIIRVKEPQHEETPQEQQGRARIEHEMKQLQENVVGIRHQMADHPPNSAEAHRLNLLLRYTFGEIHNKRLEMKRIAFERKKRALQVTEPDGKTVARSDLIGFHRLLERFMNKREYELFETVEHLIIRYETNKHDPWFTVLRNNPKIQKLVGVADAEDDDVFTQFMMRFQNVKTVTLKASDKCTVHPLFLESLLRIKCRKPKEEVRHVPINQSQDRPVTAKPAKTPKSAASPRRSTKPSSKPRPKPKTEPKSPSLKRVAVTAKQISPPVPSPPAAPRPRAPQPTVPPAPETPKKKSMFGRFKARLSRKGKKGAKNQNSNKTQTTTQPQTRGLINHYANPAKPKPIESNTKLPSKTLTSRSRTDEGSTESKEDEERREKSVSTSSERQHTQAMPATQPESFFSRKHEELAITRLRTLESLVIDDSQLPRGYALLLKQHWCSLRKLTIYGRLSDEDFGPENSDVLNMVLEKCVMLDRLWLPNVVLPAHLLLAFIQRQMAFDIETFHANKAEMRKERKSEVINRFGDSSRDGTEEKEEKEESCQGSSSNSARGLEETREDESIACSRSVAVGRRGKHNKQFHAVTEVLVHVVSGMKDGELEDALRECCGGRWAWNVHSKLRSVSGVRFDQEEKDRSYTLIQRLN